METIITHQSKYSRASYFKNFVLKNLFLSTISISLFVFFIIYIVLNIKFTSDVFNILIPTLLSYSGFFIFFTLFISFFTKILENFRQIVSCLMVYALSCSVFSLFIINNFTIFNYQTNIYMHYISRFTFDFFLYVMTCLILKIEIRNRFIFKNLFYLHIISILTILILFFMCKFNVFNTYINNETPVFITKHLLFPIKFIPYFVGIISTTKKIKNSKNIIFFLLLIAYCSGLMFQTYDELMYFEIIKKATYSILYYPYIFLFNFIYILIKYITNTYSNEIKCKKLYELSCKSICHDSIKSIEKILDVFSESELIKDKKKYKILSNSCNIIKNHLSFLSDIESSHNNLNPYNFNPNECIKIDIFDLIDEKQKENIDLIIEEKDIIIYSDQTKFIIAIENLIKNSIEHRNNGKTIITTKIHKNDLGIDVFNISIKNNGKMPNKNLDIMIDKNISTKHKNKNSKKPNGFGLYIARNSIHSIGGEIELVENKGNVCFNIYLPLTIAEESRRI